MKVFVCLLVLLTAAPAPMFAGKPKAAENNYIRMEGADFWTLPDKQNGTFLTFSFLFRFKKPLTVTRVRVEDVTEKAPVVLVDDQDPRIKKDFWTGKASARRLTPENFPWMFDHRNTTKKFRITVWSKEAPEMALEQTAKYDRSEKDLMVRMMMKKAKP
jgi:hypothetical protein